MPSNETSNGDGNSSHKKRLKVPKRGPGVAELEKMLREQKGIYTTDETNSELTDGDQYDSTHFSSKNLYSESYPFWSYFGTILKSNNEYSPLKKVKQFIETSSLSLSNGTHNHLELDSNSNSYHNYISIESEQHNMVSMKQSHSSALASDLIPPSNFRVIPSFSYYNRPLRSSINDSHSVSCFNSTKECNRDAKWGRTLELSNTRYNSDIEVHGSANVLPFATAEVPSPRLHLFPEVNNVHPCQVIEDKMNSYQQSESSGPYPRPFYNFLEVEGVTEDTNPGGCEAGKVGIDLNLKL